MKFPAAVALFSTISAVAAAYVGSPSAYTYTSVPEFEIEVSPNKTIIARGTIEQIREQALAHNPNWDEEYYAPAQKLAEERYQLVPAGADANSTGSTPSLEKRRAEDFDSLRITCGRPWHAVSYEGALKEALRLYGVKGTPQNGPGPGNCGRVGCSYGTAIIWCNDDTETKTLSSFDEIADGAFAIMQKCAHDKHGEGTKAQSTGSTAPDAATLN
ncbi:hypothetical protein AN7384.2 [Aspergillus nidulans FGSC A4]|uniref:Uncharacterized protein n=1 Tax=Emericella nidulans (strain FGSC A4 / ATCC 38163 / CBS 112.46 / NRRL 194 / M139) TaxID=227321 RepID=Q5AWE6_EMENI|nr:hypothetical protein [Aspergillus nidulans FGSC A4]EAA61755.1 hypothetical protein AN7384.2 [Aspergillus nidulans FGSC A4]CBF78490.1 TPA: conserved hypothetical protein [Aspergillus nidulans FGSC A4]|eukprot:XP_680653.1 hypothetical protein AN7384.2 [Aspergillus nidulans FGSC A4]